MMAITYALLLCARRWSYHHHPHFRDDETEAQQNYKLDRSAPNLRVSSGLAVSHLISINSGMV